MLALRDGLGYERGRDVLMPSASFLFISCDGLSTI